MGVVKIESKETEMVTFIQLESELLPKFAGDYHNIIVDTYSSDRIIIEIGINILQ